MRFLKKLILLTNIILALSYSSAFCEETEEEITKTFEEFFSTSEGEDEDHQEEIAEWEDEEILPDNVQEVNKDKLVTFNKAEIIVLNKITAKSQILTLGVGEKDFFGNIEIKLHKCVQNQDPYAFDNFTLLSIIESKTDDDPLLLFQGWMVSSSVSLSTFEHPVYEVFAKKCL